MTNIGSPAHTRVGQRSDTRFLLNVAIKAIGLFILANLIFAIWYPLPALGRLSMYNRIFPGRLRLPYGENPEHSYNLSLFNLKAMIASHEIAKGSKPDDEFRVIVIGDSSTWGYLLPPQDTLTADINKTQSFLPDGRRVRAYNLGYPVMSLTKDLLILSEVVRYEPDLILWPVTLESFPKDKQLAHPLLLNNPDIVRGLIVKFNLQLDTASAEFVESSFWDRTIVGSRRPLADLLRLQLYGVMWAATGIDQEIPLSYTPRQEDLPADITFHNLSGPHLSGSDLALDILDAAHRLAGNTPILLVNEPIFISHGENSQIRYNFYYPRWAYDDYRKLLAATTSEKGWRYLDMWDAVDNSEFTNTAVHLTPAGNEQFAIRLIDAIREIAISTAQPEDN
jgi:hypothetical protein